MSHDRTYLTQVSPRGLGSDRELVIGVRPRLEALAKTRSWHPAISPSSCLTGEGGFRGGVDLIREAVRLMMQQLMEADACERIGAGPHERTKSRATDRHGAPGVCSCGP